MIIFSLILLHLSEVYTESSNPPDFEESLKNLSIPTVGFYFQAYRSRNVEKPYTTCTFCVDCPDVKFQIEQKPKQKKENSNKAAFFPCPPEFLEVIDDYHTQLDSEYYESYYAKYTSISNTGQVRTTHRVYSVPINSDNEENIVEREDFPENFPQVADIIKGKGKLDFPTKTKKWVQPYPGGSEMSWVEFSSNDKKRWLTFTGGKSKDGRSFGETSTTWDAKDGLTRHALYINMFDLEKAQMQGCECVRKQHQTYPYVHSQLVRECRKSLTTKREDVKAAVKLSECLTKEERIGLNERVNSKLEL